jgi:predicted MFS family arabinose efflux permease
MCAITTFEFHFLIHRVSILQNCLKKVVNLSIFMLCLRTPLIRTAMIAIFLIGVSSAAARPYQSLIAIEQFQMSNGNFSKMLLAASILGIIYSLALGNLSDLMESRKLLLLLTSAAGIIGFGLIYFVPTTFIFIFSTLFIIPILSAQFSVLFGMVRTQTNAFAPGDAAAINSLVRSVFAVSWIITPALIALMLAKTVQLTLVYLIACSVCIAIFILILLTFHAPAQPKAEHAVAKPRFLKSLSAILEWRIAASILSLALMTGSQHLSTILTPLVVTKEVGGSITDVGLIVGGVAAFEIPFMLVFGEAMRRFSAGHVLSLGAAIYATYLSLMGFATQPWHFYALVPLNAAGAAAILSIPMTYLQNLLPDKPGLGSALQPITVAVGGSASAAAFAIGTNNFGYSQTAFIAAGLAMTGLIFILLLENRKQ